MALLKAKVWSIYLFLFTISAYLYGTFNIFFDYLIIAEVRYWFSPAPQLERFIPFQK